jgi:hypothetical protein
VENDEQAQRLEEQGDAMEGASEQLGKRIDQAREDWESKKSGTGAPGAVSPEAAGPHNLDAEDPATGERKGEEREDEREEALQGGTEPEQDEGDARGE